MSISIAGCSTNQKNQSKEKTESISKNQSTDAQTSLVSEAEQVTESSIDTEEMTESSSQTSPATQYLSAAEAVQLAEAYDAEHNPDVKVHLRIANPSIVYIDDDGSRFYHVLGFTDDYPEPYTAYGVNRETGEVKEAPVSFRGLNPQTEPVDETN